MNRKVILTCYLTLLFITRAAAQPIESNSSRELNFVFEVKQIDEFFERFNNVETSLFSSYLSTKYPGVSRDRYTLLTTLFNNREELRGHQLVKEFCALVTDTSHPIYLDFYSDDWYAEALCSFSFRGRPIEVTLTLKVQQTSNGGSKWMIMGATSKELRKSNLLPEYPSSSNCCKFLNPMSHATNFISLYRAFSEKKTVSDYLDTNFSVLPSSRTFITEVMNDRLKYQYVKEIRYHFLQIPGWIFTVNQYRRKGVHSGWLISTLNRASNNEKQSYRENKLILNTYQ